MSHFNADTQVRLDYINICLSYPYIENADHSRRYLLFYRWIHWTFFVLAGIYYIPRKVSKNIENPKLKRLIEDLAQNSSRYDQIEGQVVEHAAKYVTFNLKTHNGIYYKFLGLNFLALFIDMFALKFLDFVLQGRFLKYGFSAYPFERDPRQFTDYMSVMFPPFASCELEKANQLTATREERLGCHLTFMELYEKVFLFIWLWLIILMVVTSVYIIFVFLMMLPCFRMYLLRTSKPLHSHQKVTSMIIAVSKNCKVGDVYLLYRIKQHLSHARFYDLMCKLANPELSKTLLPVTQIDYHNDKGKQAGMKLNPDVRNRKNPQQDPPVNPEYLQHLISGEGFEGMQRGQHNSHHPEAQQKTPLLNKNTSILIE